MLTVTDILAALNELAPPYLALDNDPTGLLVGDPTATVTGLVVCLDVTERVLEEVRARQAEMVIAHHPLIYHPMKTVRTDQAHPGAVVWEAVRSGIAVACAHTCWDVAEGGVNDVLARLCGLEASTVRPLQVTYQESLVKITVFVPVAYRTAVLNAMADAGAGAMGDYDRCAFWTTGTGTFRPLEKANPFLGTVGRSAFVSEDRLEMIAPEAQFPAIVAAMQAAHPYEEVAYEIYPLKNTARSFGIGRIGQLREVTTVEAFLAHVQAALRFDAVRLIGPVARPIRTVAVCGGAGAFLMPDAVRAGADILVTSDVRHHEFIEAEARGFLLMDAGHAATETPGTAELANRLQTVFPDLAVTFV